MRVITFFPGLGGLPLGFRQAGFDVIHACEPDKYAAAAVAENLRIPVADPSAARPEQIPNADIMCMGTPISGSIALLCAHARRLTSVIRPRVVVAELSKKGFEDSSLMWLRDLGYNTWEENLNAIDFGLPQDRARKFTVAFRGDLKLATSVFPFPDGTSARKTLAAALDNPPDDMLTVPPSIVDRVSFADRPGRGFKPKILKPSDVAPSLSRYHKSCYDILVDDGIGPRILSISECKRIMGFPCDYKIGCSRTQAYKLIGLSTCPPIAREIAEELKAWVS
jgi:DNA (cytosine-5)-methyltransferase 1